ncbi:hypothetical protein [Adlercreutzia sp. ZJ242]|uniref:hypothetical protein n=1 Tax=Adlercreutzia sp. ZJ242 TaxID=2709409 RepID=UPI0013EC64DB|nr:hypothetical protein [Adlercreutzia sp. ZJ242]
MVFKGPAGFQRIVYIIMNVVMGIVITVCLNVLVLHAPITVDGMLTSCVLSFAVGYTVSDLVPAMDWGRALAAKLGLKPGSLGTHLVSSAVLAFFMGTLILFFCALVNVLSVGGIQGVLGFFMMGYPIVLAAAFVAIVLCVPAAMKVAAAISGFDPTKMPPQAE